MFNTDLDDWLPVLLVLLFYQNYLLSFDIHYYSLIGDYVLYFVVFDIVAHQHQIYIG